MRFGICCPASGAKRVVDAGFDYAEVGAQDLSSNVSRLSGIPIEVTNLFFPGEFRLFPPTVGDYLDHARTAISAAKALGVRVMVVGSGNQRRSPPGLDSKAALMAFVAIAEQLQEVASEFEIVIAPESLDRKETNVGNDLPELASALHERGLGYTADSFHILREAESNAASVNWVLEIPRQPTHVHLADLPRFLPELNDQAILGFLSRLREVRYDSRISFEGNLHDHSLLEAAERLRQLWRQSGRDVAIN